MKFLMIVDDPDIARYASENGVDRLFVDLEYIGKDVRQKGMATWKSKQTLEDVTKIREAAPDGHVLVRINPLHDGTKAELDEIARQRAAQAGTATAQDRDPAPATRAVCAQAVQLLQGAG